MTMMMTDGTRGGHVESMTVHGLKRGMSNNPTTIRPQGKWFIAKYAQDNHLTLAESESTLTSLIARGHLRVVFGEGGRGVDLFQFVTDNE